MKEIEGFLYREIYLKKNSFGTFLAQFINPALYLILYATTMTGVLSSITYAGQKCNYFIFTLPGFISLQTFMVFPFVGSLVASDRRFGLIRTFFISRGTPAKYFFAKIILEGTITLGEILLMILVGFIFSGFLPSVPNALLMLLAVILSFLFWLSLGILFGLYITDEVARAAILTITNLPVLFTAPIFYPIESAPTWISVMAFFNPLRYYVDAVRDSMLGCLSFITMITVIVMSLFVMLISYFILQKMCLVSRD